MVYNYTIPRAPIAAMYSSPGPCYGLPGLCGFIYQPHDPRSVHLKKPAWTFGMKNPIQSKTVGPGPKYLPHPKLYRDGFDGTPHYTMRQRLPEKHAYSTPGPGAYKPEKSFPLSTHPSAPHYSMRDRTRLRKLDTGPAPNAYTLPAVVGATPVKTQLPIYTMRPKYKRGGFSEDLANTPGPGTYDETSPSNYKRRLPIYSMGARVFPPEDSTTKPGPGTYRPEDNMYATWPEPRHVYMGIKHSPYAGTLITEPPDEIV